jgi:hypothetical protein
MSGPMIDTVEYEKFKVVYCRIVYVRAMWSRAGRNVVKLVEGLSEVVHQLRCPSLMFHSLLGTVDQTQ